MTLSAKQKVELRLAMSYLLVESSRVCSKAVSTLLHRLYQSETVLVSVGFSK